MEVSNLLSQEPFSRHRAPQSESLPQAQQHVQRYHTRHATSSSHLPGGPDGYTTPPTNSKASHAGTPVSCYVSPHSSPSPKHVSFELLFPESPSYRARLPMRVQIFPHDTTDSIITTVKNFYGLYEGPGGAKGVSFEDEHGNTLIARYENFKTGMVVYVRVLVGETAPSRAYESPSFTSGSPGHAHHNSDQHHPVPPQPAQALTYGQPDTRPPMRMTASPPPGRGRRSISAIADPDQPKQSRSRPGFRTRGSSTHGSQRDVNNDAINGFSDSDGGHGSVTSSRKAKSEQLASADISLDNIVEGGRRKRAKFESSELPLFVPPQVPMAASASSASPARRTLGHSGSTPFGHGGHRPFAFPPPLPSPQSYGYSAVGSGPGLYSASSYSTPSAPQHGHHLRTRASASLGAAHQSLGNTPMHGSGGILPTPDPTVASCISDEDVAIQLMRLGDTSNISNGTRNSASTLDDGFSGVADAASSTGGSSDDESGSETTSQPTLPARTEIESSPIPLPGSIKRRHKHLDEILPSFDSTEPSGDETTIHPDDGGATVAKDQRPIISNGDVAPVKGMQHAGLNAASSTSVKSRGGKSGSSSVKGSRVSKTQTVGSGKAKAKSKSQPLSTSKVLISPASLEPHSRKLSASSTLNFQHQLREDEEDLSSKPRCQRCRKSKKGCDRQRPCQRCKDAGIGVDGCVSEDEGNGRKGRFGRHMGVIVKKHSGALVEGSSPGQSLSAGAATSNSVGNTENNKKRKR
ncbi:MAG: hypothetical protein M1817_003536 [Caeruleum heppii]|nr:MAG: hypothetical protein M1817_003536 [Caeruleum heppii]